MCCKEIEYTYLTEGIPFFSDILITGAHCECGFRHTDTLVLGEGDPVRWEMHIDTSEDLMVRIVRSSTCTIQVPELGVRIDPGPACEASITNVEGILQRIRETVESVRTWAENAERECANSLLNTISKAIDGSFQFTLIMEDPEGNSAIISEKAKKAFCQG